MGRPSFPHIGWDPTPGDPVQTRELAKKLGRLAAELGTALRELEQIECGAWKGKAATAFVDHISTDVTPLIRKSHGSFDKASRALHRWAGELEDFQDEADRLEKSAGQKLDDRDDAKAKGKDLGDASSAVDEVTDKVYDLEGRYKRAAALISKDLDKAADIAPDEPGFFDKLVHGVEDAWNATVKWVQDHADMIKLIGDLLSDLTGILGFLAIVTLPFEPLGAIFGTLALITGGLALGAHSLAKAAGADVSWMSIGLDAVGLLPGLGAFGKGAKLARGADMTEAAAKFGKGFTATVLPTSRNLFSTGEIAKDVSGGLKLFGGKVALGGTSTNLVQVAHESSTLMSKMAGISNAGYHSGQLLGSKGLQMITGGHVALNPMGAGGIALDATLKIAPKTISIPQHIGDAVNPGNRFHEFATH